jgi:hypothetical protein
MIAAAGALMYLAGSATDVSQMRVRMIGGGIIVILCCLAWHYHNAAGGP